jgi:hypothetical protein
MDLSAEFTEIESLPFNVVLFHVDGFNNFLDVVEQKPAVQKLQEAAKIKEGRELILERVNQLCALPPDDKAWELLDRPLAIYMHVLYWKDHEAGRKAAEKIYPLPDLYFAYGISKAILTREENQSQAAGE